MMKSRAHMLLEKDYMKLQKEPIWGIFAQPLNDEDFFIWEAKVYGLKDTLWEGGIFKLCLKFSESYNCSPPEVFFTTIPYHPNVHMSTGKPCADFLDDAQKWKEFYNVGNILLSLQLLLANPVLENAINKEAALLYRDNIEVYRETVMNCVLVSKRLDAELLPNSTEEDAILPQAEFTEEESVKPNKNKLQSSKVSFEEYLTLWKGIATSNPSASPLNPLSEFLKTDPKLQKAHFELSRAEVEQEIRIQLSEHRKLMYGKFDGEEERYRGTIGSPRRSLPDPVMMLRNVYAAKPNTAETSSIESPALKDDLVDLDNEAIDLVNWTRSLSPEQMYY